MGSAEATAENFRRRFPFGAALLAGFAGQLGEPAGGDGKVRLLREDYCDGPGNCLPTCPTGAITFEEREAPAYDHAAVMAAKAAKEKSAAPLPCGCPGSMSRAIHREASPVAAGEIPSELRQWPVQLKLVNPMSPWLSGADVLIAADCTAYAYGAFHRDFIRGRVVLVGCPELDEGDYTDKLTEIFRRNDVRSVTVALLSSPTFQQPPAGSSRFPAFP